VKGFVLTPALKGPLRYTGLSSQGIEKPVGRVDAVEVFRYLATEESLRNGLRRITLHLDGPSLVVDGHEHGTRIRAVVRTNCVHDAKWGSGTRRHAAIVGQVDFGAWPSRELDDSTLRDCALYLPCLAITSEAIFL